MKILIIDNYDSFTYNLVQYIERITQQRVDVVRNDQITLSQAEKYDKIVLSPGPGVPSEAPMLLKVIKELYTKKSILGVCLGHQAIGQFFGAKLVNIQKVFHGIATEIKALQEHYLFDGLPNKIEVGRYHSWIINIDEHLTETIPLKVIAKSKEGHIMAIQHEKYDICGIQFHPESILTPHGYTMLENWINY